MSVACRSRVDRVTIDISIDASVDVSVVAPYKIHDPTKRLEATRGKHGFVIFFGSELL